MTQVNWCRCTIRAMVNTITIIRTKLYKRLNMFLSFGKGQLRTIASLSRAALSLSLPTMTPRFSVLFRPQKHAGVFGV